MRIDVPYGKDEHLAVELPEARLAGILEPNDVPIADERETLLRDVREPLDAPPLAEFLRGGQEVLFIVNDATRPTPTARVLDAIGDVLEADGAGPLAEAPIRFIVATGIHRAPTEEEYRQCFGAHLDTFRDRIHAHDARTDEMVTLGTSKNGTVMEVNRLGAEAAKIVIIGSVEPHYFAGYTGGRKSFLPGIASHRTIEQNHKLALSSDAKALALEGNPVHEDMIDALATVRTEVFSIQTVLDKHHRIYAATAGHIHRSFEAAIERANEVFAARIPRREDVVVSVVEHPQEIDLYQAQKGLDNGKLALAKGGVLILAAKCRTGLGEESFADLLTSASSPQDALDRIGRQYVLGYHKAAKMAEIGLWAEMWGVTDLPDAQLEGMFIRPFPDLQSAVDAALEKKGPTARVLFLMDGGLTVPLVG